MCGRGMNVRVAGAMMVIGISSNVALAQDEPRSPWVEPPEIRTQPITLTLRPALWLPRLGGDVQYGPAPADRVQIDDELNLRDGQATFLGELVVRKQDYWELQFTGFSFSTDNSFTAPRAMQFGGIALAPGQPFRNDFSFDSISGEVRMGMFQPFPPAEDPHGLNCTSCGRRTVDLRLSPILGARYLNVRQSLETGASREEARGEWLVPYVGLNFELTYRPDGRWPLTDSLVIEVAGAGGPALGGDGGFAWHIQAGITWFATENIGLTFGYRLVEMDVERGDYQVKAGLQGLIVAGSLRF